jgi:tetratricopeptide (TPR) repeat protein
MNFRYHICLLSFLCFFGTLFSQEKDSLQQLSFDELKSSYSKLQFSNAKTAKIYADVILEKAISEKNIKEENNAYLLQSRSEGYFGNMSNALALTEKSISYAKQFGNTDFYVTAIRRKGMVYYNFGKYDDAVTYYLKIDSIARITKNIDYQIDSNQSIGAVKTVLGDHRSAVKLFLENEAILAPLQKDPNYTTQYLNTLIGLCSAYTYLDIPKA